MNTQNTKDSCSAILLTTYSRQKTVTISSELNVDNLDYSKITTLYKKRGTGKIERYCSWEIDNYIISIFGWKNGNAGLENKTELPPPEDNDIFFGDILVIKSELNSGKVLDLTISDYKQFYDEAYGGFESLGSDTSSCNSNYNDVYISDDGFIVDSDNVEELDNKISSNSEEEEASYGETSTSNDSSYKEDGNSSIYSNDSNDNAKKNTTSIKERLRKKSILEEDAI